MSLTALELLQVSEDALKEAQAAVAQALQVDRQHGTYSTSNAEAFTKGLADPEVNRKADADIKELAENVKTIRADFQQVYPQLASADTFAAALSGGSYTPISPKWKDIYERFDRALSASVQLAPLAVDTLDSVQDLLGSATETTPGGDLKARLQSFMQEVKIREQQALGTKNDFQDVVDRLRLFWAEVEEAMKNPFFAIFNLLVTAGLYATVKALEVRLESLQTKMSALQQAIVSDIASGGLGATTTIFQLCPSAFLTALQRGYGMESALVALITDSQLQKDVLESEMERTRQEILAVAQGQAAGAAYLVILADPKRFLDGIALKMDTIVNIWQTINLDLHALYGDLDSNIGDDTVITKFWLAKMRVSKDIYAKLSWMCNLYKDQMSKALQ